MNQCGAHLWVAAMTTDKNSRACFIVLNKNRGVKNVPRPRANIRISLKARGGPTYRIELVRIPFTKRFRIRRNGSKSAKLPVGTATEVAEEIRRWLATQTSKPTTEEDILGPTS
jgi:hypothetical protein